MHSYTNSKHSNNLSFDGSNVANLSFGSKCDKVNKMTHTIRD